MKKIIPIIALGITVSFCTPKEEKGVETTATVDTAKDKSNLAIEFDKITINLDTSWTLIDSGFVNLTFSVNRLMQEVGYTNGYDVAQYENLKDQIKTLDQFRYKQSEIPDFETVGLHDEQADALISAIISFASNVPEKENHPLISELITEINQLNSQDIVSFRTHYSNTVETYNTFVGENKTELEKLGYNNLEPYPSYFLMQ